MADLGLSNGKFSINVNKHTTIPFYHEYNATVQFIRNNVLMSKVDSEVIRQLGNALIKIAEDIEYEELAETIVDEIRKEEDKQ